MAAADHPGWSAGEEEAPKISFLYQMNYFVNVLWKHFLQMVKKIQSIVMTIFMIELNFNSCILKAGIRSQLT